MLIPHPRPLRPARFIARYDRFIARVELDGGEVDAHCVNPGRMEGLVVPGARAWVSTVPAESKRKLRYTLELLEIEGSLVGVNTQLPNLLAETLIRSAQIPGMKRFDRLEREVRYGVNSRVDILLHDARGRHYVEVKNCHLVYPDGGAYFPDSVSTRAAGHLEELIRCVEDGDRASVLHTVQRGDGRFLRPSDLHDPVYAATARRAARAGVRFHAVCLQPGIDGFTFLGTLPVRLRPYRLEPLRPYREALAARSGWQRRGGKT
ncbi:MAG: DNA/RNA nuclease SfsA [Halieaceae bacterium]|nr:DNA/RNA nuclease SfsA [Halieaceae bacterium]